MKNKAVLGLLVIVALGVGLWALLSKATHDASDARRDAGPRLAVAPTAPLPQFDAGAAPSPPIDPEDAGLTPAVVQELGVFHRSVKWADTLFPADGWRKWQKVADTPGPTYRDSAGTQVVIRVENGVMVGARATFRPHAFRTEIQSLSPELVGFHAGLEPMGTALANNPDKGPEVHGDFEVPNGMKLYYRGIIRNREKPGETVEWIEYSVRPFTD